MPLYTLHVSGELVHDFCGVIKPRTAYADVWQAHWNTALLRGSVSTATISNEHNQTNKKTHGQWKTLLNIRDSKSYTLIISRTHDVRFTAPHEVFWWQRYKRDKKNARKTTRLRAHILQRSSHNVAKYARHANISEVTWLWHQNKTKHVWRKRTEAWSISGVRSRHHHLQRQIDANMIKSNDRIHASYEPPWKTWHETWWTA